MKYQGDWELAFEKIGTIMIIVALVAGMSLMLAVQLHLLPAIWN